MNATTENDSNDGPDDGAAAVDWTALAPEGGERIPELLGRLAGSDAALSDLHDLIDFPAPGHMAAPAVVDFLVDIALDEQTPPTDRWRPLSLLLELVTAHAEDRFPQPRDLDQWRDEVAWATSNDIEKVREQYQAWAEEAPDEQQYLRMRNRLKAIDGPAGTAVLRAELETFEAVCARVPDLVALLKGAANRRGLDRAGEWVSYLLAFLAPEAERVSAEITGASQILLAKDLRPTPQAPTSLRDAMTGALDDGGEPLPAEIFALGLAASPRDVDTTIGLTHQMAGGNLYNSFAAAVAVVLIHGENTPREGLRRIGRGGGTSMGYEGLFNESWPHCGVRSPQVLGFLALGRAGDRARRLRLDILPGLLKGGDDSRALVTGVGLEMVLGPRSKGHSAEEHANAEYDEETLKVLWEIAELPESAWADEEFADTLRAWALPGEREEFCALVGVDPDAEEEEAAPAQAQAPAAPEPGGLLGRLFGGGGARR
ncbi:hypothetical protein DFP74_6184 [Nocardiopsis sp. Huas11]|uniref:hypothetical protein n=1 Tax=Nocardiopsis sp. Huas11 TaxID=2183912 RepID=UPI000EB35C6F|nr:hypothetical protein [Nocardiopsis sp. Huas11]RKS10418.1 hypothetical protein DFP74_6184 [Nocardiopsis sp. Huas11]